MITACSSMKIFLYEMCMTHFAEACGMIIAELNLWLPLIHEPGLTWKPVWYFIPGKLHPVILVS